MPALSTDVALYIKHVRDALRFGAGYTSAQYTVGTTTSRVQFVANDPGEAGNAITVQVTLPTITAGLTVSVSGKEITIALAQVSGTPTGASNTSTLIAAAVNASSAAAALVTAYVPLTAGAGSISAAVAATALSGGVGGANGVQTYPLNFLRAQDSATVLELLSSAVSQTGTLTATGGSTTTVVDGAGTFVPGQQDGNYVKFKSNTTTAALQGKSYLISGSTDRQLTTATAMAGTVVNGDTYEIVCGQTLAEVTALRQGKFIGDATPNIYGDFRVMQNGLQKLTQALTVTQATGTLTFTGNPADSNTVTINGKVYTFKTVLGTADGNVKIGGTAAASLTSLISAINLTAGGSGVDWGSSTVIHPTVSAAEAAGDTMLITAKTLSGALGNAITTPATTVTGGTWASPTLTGGVSGTTLRANILATLSTGSGSTTTAVVINTAVYGKMRIDEHKSTNVNISGVTRTVVGNDETTLTLSSALGSAPSASTTVTLTRNLTFDVMPTRIHPGGQQGNNMRLADHIAQAQAAVVAYTLPT